MTTPLTLKTVTQSDWPSISAAFRDLTYEQSLTYASAAAARIGAEAQFVTLTDNSGQHVAAACLRFKRIPGLGRGIAWIAAGPLVQRRGQSDASAEDLRAVLAALRAHAQTTGNILRLRFPALAQYDPATLGLMATQEGFEPTTRAASYRTVIVDCDQNEDTLMRALHGKWRNPLRNALKAGLGFEHLPILEGAERFDTLYREVQAVKGFDPDIPPAFYYALDGADFTHEVLIARKHGVDIAGMTIGRAGENAVYLFGATTDAGRHLNAGHYLMWQSILRCRALGMKSLDLGGIDPDANPSVTRFKQRTGGTDTVAAGPFEFRPGGLTSTLIGVAETTHTRLKGLR